MLARLRNGAARARLRAALAGREPIPGWDNLSLRIGWERTVVGSASGLGEWEGKNIAEIAAGRRQQPTEVLFELLLKTRGGAVGIWHHMREDDVRTVMQHPAQMVGSDGLHTSGKPHPRLWGTFPRVLGRYVREEGLLTLEQAIHKMTGRAAAVFGLGRLGLLREGYRADVCVFDPEKVADRATYAQPTEPPEGVVHVICNGRPTLMGGRRTEHTPGRWLG